MSAHVGRFIRDLRMNVYPSGASQFFHLPVTLYNFDLPDNGSISVVVDLHVCVIGYTGRYHLLKEASHSIGSLTIFSKQTCHDYTS